MVPGTIVQRNKINNGAYNGTKVVCYNGTILQYNGAILQYCSACVCTVKWAMAQQVKSARIHETD